MGQEATCQVKSGRRTSTGRAYLEPHALTFSGEFQLKIPLAEVSAVDARRGVLSVTAPAGTVEFELGAAADAWALKIRYPRSRLEKIGVKPGHLVSVLSVDDETFLQELSALDVTVSAGKARPRSDIIIVGVSARTDLDRLAALRETIVPNGAIWTVWPKGQKTLREDDVRAAAKAMGLVDVKVMSFSDRLSGLKLVIPVALRPVALRPASPKKPAASKPTLPAPSRGGVKRVNATNARAAAASVKKTASAPGKNAGTKPIGKKKTR